MEREWSCYGGGQFNGGRMIMLERGSVFLGRMVILQRGQFYLGRMVILQRCSL